MSFSFKILNMNRYMFPSGSGFIFRPLILIFLLLIIGSYWAPLSLSDPASPDDLKLWFTRPAVQWDNALPVGNGRLGAMVFGGIETERIQLNEESVWTGKDEDYHNPESLEGLQEVRKLLFNGKYVEAEKTAQEKIMGTIDPSSLHTYQTLGDLHLFFSPYRNVSDYRRELDLETAVACVNYLADGVRYTREIFSSAPDDVLVIRLTADRKGSLSFNVLLSRPGNKAIIDANENIISMTEHVGDGAGVIMVASLEVIPEGGSMSISGDNIRVAEADAVTMLLGAATDYRGGDPFLKSGYQLAAASEKNYEKLKEDHIADYQRYFKMVDLDLGRRMLCICRQMTGLRQ
jgi:alpha-L-fucosidase 2